MSEPNHSQRTPLERSAILLLTFVVSVGAMRVASELVIPLLLAATIATISWPPYHKLRDLGVNTTFSLILVIIFQLCLGIFAIVILSTSLVNFQDQIPIYREAIKSQIEPIKAWTTERGIQWPEQISGVMDSTDLMDYLSIAAGAATTLLSQTFLIVLLAIFMILEAVSLPPKLRALNAGQDSRQSSRQGSGKGSRQDSEERFNNIFSNVRQYLFIKTLMSLLTAVCVSLMLWLMGIDAVLLLSLLMFFFNFIPNVGAVLAAIPACLIAFAQGNIYLAIWVALGYSAINLTVANLVEPPLMGKKLGISTLAAVISMVFWGWVLGPVGVVLSIPLTLATKVSMECFEETRGLAIFLGPPLE